MCQREFLVLLETADTAARKPFIAAAMSLVAAAPRSVRVASGAFRLSPRSRVFFSTRLFIVISLGDELYAGSKPCFLMTGAAAGAVMNLTSARAVSACFAPAWMPAENM